MMKRKYTPYCSQENKNRPIGKFTGKTAKKVDEWLINRLAEMVYS